MEQNEFDLELTLKMAEECGVKVNLNGSGKITINGEPITDKRLFDIFYGDMETDNDK